MEELFTFENVNVDSRRGRKRPWLRFWAIPAVVEAEVTTRKVAAGGKRGRIVGEGTEDPYRRP